MSRLAPAHTMPAVAALPVVPLLVFTDLDGTLLDHHGYGFEPARPALTRLAQLQVPLIPTTSKTLAEVSLLQTELHNPHPCIVENGGALCVPAGYFDDLGDWPLIDGYQVLALGPEYGEVLSILHGIRRDTGWRFRGFHDMDVDELAADTGLSRAAAERARQRLSSEPLRWEDSDQAFEAFRRRLDDAGLNLTRGGRYWHVMGRTDKGRAMARLCARYRQAGYADFTTVALGDSPNDQQLLEQADIAVVVRRPDGEWLDVQGRHHTIRTDATGPDGWNDAVTRLLHNLAPDPRP